MEDREIKRFVGSKRTTGSGNGHGKGCGNGYGNGIGIGYGNGNGRGYGDGNGDGYGNGYDNGKGYGNGNGCGYGDGNGIGFGNGIQEINNVRIYNIDNIPTAITAIHGNVAKGFILKRNVLQEPCYIVKEGDSFAHGETLHDAYAALNEKLYDDSSEEERLKAFKDHFPEYDKPYDNRELFSYHHVLTGSCKFGRQQFVEEHGINLDEKTSVRDFIKLTENSFGREMIKQLRKEYERNSKGTII